MQPTLQLPGKARPRAGRGSSATVPVLLSGSACALLELSSCPKDFTYSHLRILEECQETGLLEALLRYLMQLQDEGGGSRGLGASTITTAEGALNTELCPEQLRCHNSWSGGAW